MVLTGCILFQFHKGAIGVIDSCLLPKSVAKFQFHKGAIGVKAFHAVNMKEEKFQFHKGAIGVVRRNSRECV